MGCPWERGQFTAKKGCLEPRQALARQLGPIKEWCKIWPCIEREFYGNYFFFFFLFFYMVNNFVQFRLFGYSLNSANKVLFTETLSLKIKRAHNKLYIYFFVSFMIWSSRAAFSRVACCTRVVGVGYVWRDQGFHNQAVALSQRYQVQQLLNRARVKWYIRLLKNSKISTRQKQKPEIWISQLWELCGAAHSPRIRSIFTFIDCLSSSSNSRFFAAKRLYDKRQTGGHRVYSYFYFFIIFIKQIFFAA